MLRDLRQHTSTEQAARIDDLLASVIEDVADAAAIVQDPTDKYRGPIFDDDRHEADASVEVGSSGEPELLDEDVMRDEETRATGFVGNASEVQWLRRLHGGSASHVSDDRARGLQGSLGHDDDAVDDRLAAFRERRDSYSTPALMPSNKASFYLDNEVFETDLAVDPFELPPFEIAEKLLQSYMESAHNSFPVLAKKTFVNRFYHYKLCAISLDSAGYFCFYYASVQRDNPYNVPRKWQATLNLVFAIGAVYSHLTMAEWRADKRDHLTYHSRAWALSLRDPWWFSHPDLPHMQITGLLSFYYLSIGHINRSWVLIGTALRSGFALGLHLRNEDGSTGAARKEIHSRIWWAHYSFERLVSALTGRPSMGMGHLCSVPLPLPLSCDDIEESIIASRFGDKGKRTMMLHRSTGSTQAMEFSAQSYHTPNSESANSGSYLKSMVQISEITQVALSLYGANTERGSWETTQSTIAHHNEELDAWATALPDGLNFLRRSGVLDHRYRREQNTLDIMYHSTKILITRPCLCRLDRRIANQSASSNTFNQRAALLCVNAAKSIAGLLPDATERNLVMPYQAGPWWQLVHIVMQALVVLLLEIVLEQRYFPDDRLEVVSPLKKLLRWLRIMRANNEMAVRAYSLSLALMKKLASNIQFDIRDLIDEDEFMTSSSGPSPHPSAQSQAYTPYPNVLNPVDDPHAPMASFAPPSTRNTQQTTRQQRQQYPSISSQGQGSQFASPTPSYQLSPSHIDKVIKTDLSAFDNLFLTSSGFEQVVFPGWFVTSFDEHDLFSGLESPQMNST
ncbi:hypothetical protein E8E12_006913 [Didymella heteroderae]|uniref:Xylanolytic transcriptional activator regulatory domain-containing protein n=1 Tax=Didymella heteroderae TaxID=1769908 RepID=A0A9P5C3V6_9PLEO|nr:hypothetical protein E8E12_006913 [Didymella heteroderae]